MNYHKTILDNGLRVITVPMSDTPTATVMILVEAGSKYETKLNNGVSHFLEHMCFKGTTNRPTAQVIAHELDALGAKNNAFTSKEYTGYYAKARSAHAHQIIDIVSDIYLNPLLPDQEIKKERGVILEELNMYNDIPQENVFELWQQLLYGNQPAGWSTIGTKSTLRKIDRTALASYHTIHYKAPKTTIIVAGNINERQVMTHIKRLFATLPGGKSARQQKTCVTQNKPGIALKNKKIDQVHMILGCHAFNLYDKRRWALAVLSSILGKGMSSRLFQRLREDLGICYYIGSSISAQTDVGTFQVSAGVDTRRVALAVQVILQELSRIKEELVSKSEFEKSKEMIVANLEMGLESSDDWADFYGAQEVVWLPIQKPKEIIKEIQAITTEEVRQIARFVFQDVKLNCAMVGPLESMRSIKKIMHF